jgi:hypothetical protein
MLTASEMSTMPPIPDGDDVAASSEASSQQEFSCVKTLANLAEEEVLRQLKKAIKGPRSNASYCSGGMIPIVSEPTLREDTTILKPPLTAPPVVIRWDAPDGSKAGGKIQFPLTTKAASDYQKAFSTNQSKAKKLSRRNLAVPQQTNLSEFDELIRDCLPLAFECDGQDISDGAWPYKLDNTQFAINFQPQEYGILDAITQILMPEYETDDPDQQEGTGSEECRAISAELAELNVSSLIQAERITC